MNAEAASVRAQLAIARSAPAPAVGAQEERHDFARSLGAPLPTAKLVQDLQRASAEAGVALVSVQAQEREPTTEQLGRLEMSVALRGGYVASKQVLKQVTERYPQLTVHRLRMRRGASANEVETQVTLSVWSAPLAAERNQ